MIVACPSCRGDLDVSDEELRKGVARVKCQHCGFAFVIRLGDPGASKRQEPPPQPPRLEGVKTSGSTSSTAGEIGASKQKFIAAETRSSIHVDDNFRQEIESLKSAPAPMQVAPEAPPRRDPTDKVFPPRSAPPLASAPTPTDTPLPPIQQVPTLVTRVPPPEAPPAPALATLATPTDRGPAPIDEEATELDAVVDFAEVRPPSPPPIPEAPAPATTAPAAAPVEPTPAPVDEAWTLPPPTPWVAPPSEPEPAIEAQPQQVMAPPPDAPEPSPPRPLAATPFPGVQAVAPRTPTAPLAATPIPEALLAGHVVASTPPAATPLSAQPIPVAPPSGTPAPAPFTWPHVSAAPAAAPPLPPQTPAAGVYPPVPPPLPTVPAPAPVAQLLPPNPAVGAIPVYTLSPFQTRHPGMAPRALTYSGDVSLEDLGLVDTSQSKAFRVFAIGFLSIIGLLALFFLFVVARNGWSIDFAEFGAMIDHAFTGSPRGRPVADEFRGLEVTSPVVEEATLSLGARVLTARGQVKNNDTRDRRYIYVRAQLKDHHGRLIVSVEAPAGNLFTKEELSKLTPSGLEAQLNPAGRAKENARVAGGQMIDYMVVIANKPEDYSAERYSVVVEASQAEFLVGK
jgi:predicted Zn finger-like uncharacterized protein